jgi:hypothetical protein
MSGGGSFGGEITGVKAGTLRAFAVYNSVV